MSRVVKMKSVKRADGWWITNVPECEDCGPYATKADADEDRLGLERTFANWDNRAFWTSDKRK